MAKNFSQRRASHKFDRDRYFSPEDITDRARCVMGTIDLDPASEISANATIKAKRYFTVVSNGLKRQWIGSDLSRDASSNVWLNPPYSKGKIARFIAKAIIEFRSGRVKNMMILVNVSGSSMWWHLLLKAANKWGCPILFFKKRLKFYNPEVDKLIREGKIDKQDSNNASQALFFFSKSEKRKAYFSREFKDLGIIIYPEINL